MRKPVTYLLKDNYDDNEDDDDDDDDDDDSDDIWWREQIFPYLHIILYHL